MTVFRFQESGHFLHLADICPACRLRQSGNCTTNALLAGIWHRRNVKKEDVPAYTKLMGLSLIAIGAGCLVTGIVACVLEETLGWLALPAGFVVGFALIWKAQKKYNGGKMIS